MRFVVKQNVLTIVTWFLIATFRSAYHISESSGYGFDLLSETIKKSVFCYRRGLHLSLLYRLYLIALSSSRPD